MFRLIRHNANPILKPRPDLLWEREGVFNPGIAKVGDEIIMLYRAVGERDAYISHIGLATSKDGVNFARYAKDAPRSGSGDSSLGDLLATVLPTPVIGPSSIIDKWATEDCRITPIGDDFYVTYVAVPERIMDHDKGIERVLPLTTSTALLRTRDFLSFEHLGIISPIHSDNKDIVLFPKKIMSNYDGKGARERYMMLHRPNRWSKEWFAGAFAKAIDVPLPPLMTPEALPTLPSIWIAESDDLIIWDNHRLLLSPSHAHDAKIGPGIPPIETPDGWLMIYHHVDLCENHETHVSTFRYSMRAALLDLADPTKIIGKLPYDILEPEMPYETDKGTRIVFPTGGYVADGILHVYYGASDFTIGLASGSLDQLLAELKNEGVGGKTHHETA
jgi:predicted GH43/DUF377 family glycosyl hydrolase